MRLLFVLLCNLSLLGRSQTLNECSWCKFLNVYPNQYNTIKLKKTETITIDGYLNESAWIDVPFTNSSFVDIAQLLYNSSTNGYQIPSKNYSTKVKIRWDSLYLYIGAILYEPFVYGSKTGHNQVGNVPYADHDFEVFIDPSGTNFYYKEFEINVLNATYDVLWHKTKPIPCNTSIYGNYTYNNSITNNIWCSDTTYDNNGNWTMYNPLNDNGLKTATSIQQIANSSQKTVCDPPCPGCPDESITGTPMAWCPWSYLSADNDNKCNEWPQILTESWTLEIRMPFQHNMDQENKGFGGLLDTDNITMNHIFIDKYNPNSFNNLNEDRLYWWIDFGRTEHPIGFNESNVWTIIENETILNEVLKVYPSLLGIYPWNNYWEWTWQSVGITQYMHYPQYWGILQFVENNEYDNCLNVEWPARYLIYSLWWANYEYFLYFNGTKYSSNVNELLNDNFCQFGYCDLNALKQAVYSSESCFSFNIYIDSQKGCINFMSGNLTLEQKLYSGMCYHSSIYVNVDDSRENGYMINITESHFVSVQKDNFSLCL